MTVLHWAGRIALAVLAIVTLGVSAVFTAAYAFGATVLIVPPTGMPNPALVPNAMTNAQQYYLQNTACGTPGACTPDDVTVIEYPASFWPMTFLPHWCETDCQKWDVSVDDGFDALRVDIEAALAANDDPVVIFGHSQGSAVISQALGYFATRLTAQEKARLQVVMTGNIDNPAGGLWSRLGFLGHIPFLDVTTGVPTPTDTGITFTSIIMQYDGVGNAPKYWGNLLSVANAVAGFVYLHGSTLAPDEYTYPCHVPHCGVPDFYPTAEDYLAQVYDPANAKQDAHGNTYVVVPSPTLPIVMPLLELGARTNTLALVQPIVNLVSPVLRVLIDLGYDPHENPGVYSPLSILPFSLSTDPVKLVADLVRAVAQGIHDAVTGGPVADISPTSRVALPADVPKPVATNLKAIAAEPLSAEPLSKHANDTSRAADGSGADAEASVPDVRPSVASGDVDDTKPSSTKPETTKPDKTTPDKTTPDKATPEKVTDADEPDPRVSDGTARVDEPDTTDDSHPAKKDTDKEKTDDGKEAS